MSQILHIFRKDVRHFWIEILASLVLLVAYTWKTIHGWSAQPEFPGLSDILWQWVTPLLPISWCFLVIRAVHDESLVGDRQFWVTRPYEWPKLLAAKALLAVTFINVPLFIADIVLLHEAGFAAMHYLFGLLGMQLSMATFLILPTIVAAAVTSTVVQVLLSVVAILLYVIGASSIESIVPNAGVGPGSAILGTFGLIFLLCGAIAVTLIQFARRWAWRSRLLILAAAMIMLVAPTVMPYGTLTAHAYPLATAGEPPIARLELEPPLPPSPAKRVPEESDGKVALLFPMRVSEVAQGSVVIESGTVATIRSADGRSWTSRWLAEGGLLWPAQDATYERVWVDKKFLQQEQSTPVAVHLSFALTSYRETESRQVVAREGIFALPGVGFCWVDNQGRLRGNRIECRAPLVSPGFMARMEPSASTCPPPANLAQMDLGTRYAWGGPPRPAFAAFGISAVDDLAIWFQRWTDDEAKGSPPGTCAGTPFTISTPQIGKSVRIDAEIEGVHLNDYVVRTDSASGGGSAGGVGIMWDR